MSDRTSGATRDGTRTLLAGVTVLDFSQVVSGPICGRLLADLGADVVKVEPFDGDIIRHLEPKTGDHATSVYFTWANAGKRSLAVNLRDARGADLTRRLALASDVVLENFRPGVLAKFGLDAATLLEQNPALVYCSINGWGTGNSWSNRRAYAAMVQAEVGRVELDARLREAPPEQSPHVDGDIQPGLLAVSGIVAALFRRERTGQGEHVDVSMAEALLYTDEWTSTELAGYEGPRIPDTWKYPVFAVADGTGVAFMGDPHPRFVEIAAALTDDEIVPPGTRDASLRVIAGLVARYPDFPTLEAQLDRFGFLVAEVRTVLDVAGTPWAAERAVFEEVEPGARVPARPFKVRNGVVGVQDRAPHLGEHTRAVLAERLGLDVAALDALEADGVIAPDSPNPPLPDRLRRGSD
jgi:crotonobetainyl-CoA:carnitine CoA-transferase CaiB-like acyl-CoA transferase